MWENLFFPKIKNHSEYKIIDTDSGILQIKSDSSASALISLKTFNLNKYPILKWKWKIDDVINDLNPKKKKGDDYPIRIYIIFEYNPDKGKNKIEYGIAKLLYGEYPPDSALNYVWGNSFTREKYYKNPYTDRAIMIPLNYGVNLKGKWIEHEINVLDDYLKIFGKTPPDKAKIAIMGDSDNSKSNTTAYIDYIIVLKE